MFVNQHICNSAWRPWYTEFHMAFRGAWNLHGLLLSDYGFGDVPDTLFLQYLESKKVTSLNMEANLPVVWLTFFTPSSLTSQDKSS